MTYDAVKDFAIGILKLKPWEFYRMTMGEYMAACIGYQNDRYAHLGEYRRILAAIYGTDPRRLFELPGDWSHLDGIKQKSQEELKERFKKLGLDKVTGIKLD